MEKLQLLSFFIIIVTWTVPGSCNQTNIVLIVTDDQDLTLGGLTPMVKTQKIIANMGVTFTNAFVTTPICCPSRASIFSGQYQHNHHTRNNSVSGGCSGPYWQQHVEPQAWPALLHQAGYTTFYAGKYLNQLCQWVIRSPHFRGNIVSSSSRAEVCKKNKDTTLPQNIGICLPVVISHKSGVLNYTTEKTSKLARYGYRKTGGATHVPAGWDWWIGLVGNSRYYNYTLSVNGTAVFHSDDYLTNVIEAFGLEFLRQHHVTEKNFLMVLAPPAPHAPFTPAPKYKDRYKNVKAMRTPNFNVPVFRDKHWLLQMPPSPLPDSMLPELDRVYRQRWETLLSVDDLIESMVIKLESLRLLDKTHFIVTSDHGYHVGQFGLPWDKRQPYEMDIRIPLMMRGPGLPHRQMNTRPVLNIDFAPTFLAMAGLEAPPWMDGISFFPLSKQNADDGTGMDRKFLIEYHGEGSRKTVSPDCLYDEVDTLSNCVPEQMCKCQDSRNNTFTCVRHLEPHMTPHLMSSYNFLFCKFRDSENFTEAYDLNVDPYQLDNLALSLSPAIENKYMSWLEHLKFCSGLSCHLHHDPDAQNSP